MFKRFANSFKFSEKLKKNNFDITLIDSVFEQLRTYLIKIKNKDIKVIDYKAPEELKKLIPFELDDTKGATSKEILEYTQKVIDYSVHSSASNYYNTLFGGIDERALAGEYVTSTLNGTVYTYELAPVYTLMEEEVVKKYSQLLKWKEYDYMFCPGGSYANLYGVTSARAKKFPKFKHIGLSKLPNMKLFYSESGHYSIQKAGILCGFGLDNVIKVGNDSKGRINIDKLKKELEICEKESSVPIAIISTLGTTVMGAIDPITEVDKICKEKGIWHHVDACLGNGLLFLEDFVKSEPGLFTADSIAIDPHKILNIPQQCSLFMTRHTDLLYEANSTSADYLFMKDKVLYDSKLDKGDKSFQCGRHIDVVKFWMFWKYHTTSGIRSQIVELINNARYLADLVKQHKNYELLFEPTYNTVCFYYLPDRFLNHTRNKELYEEVGKITPRIKAEMVKRGNLMMAFQKMKFNNVDYPNFLRPSITVGKDREDMEFIIKEIHDIGKNM